MVSTLRYSLNSKDTNHLPYPSTLATRDTLGEISNISYPSPRTTSVNDNFFDVTFSMLSHSHSTFHAGHVDRHDTDAWSQEWNEWKVHDTQFNAVEPSSSVKSNGAVPSDCPPTDVATNCSTPMELRTWHGLWNVKKFSDGVAPSENNIFQLREWTLVDIPGSGVSVVPSDATIKSCLHEDLSEGRRRVGEILIRCGVINVSGMSPIESAIGWCDVSHSDPVDARVVSHAYGRVLFDDNDEILIAASANWTSEWVYTFVVQPYLLGSFRFRYRGKPSTVCSSIALRIRRVLSNVYNPVQVAIHALWFISTLTGNGAHDNAPFLSIPIFRYLHNNGAFVAEDFMFHTFVTCAMIGDKTINDASLSTNTWSRLTRIPQVVLNATEKYTLGCLKWDVVMSPIQWQDTIIHLRSCIKMGSVFDPFAYDEASSSGIIARYLDELINRSYANEATSQQATLIEGNREISYNSVEWCPRVIL